MIGRAPMRIAAAALLLALAACKPEAPPPTIDWDKAIAEADARMKEAEAMDPPPALVILAKRFGLTRLERDILLLCVAINLDSGTIVWQTAHGETPDNIKNNPALKGVTIPRTGRPGIIGTLVTKSLVIAGEPGFFTTPNGRGAMLRAYDKSTGKEVGAVYMPAPLSGSPMTYMMNGHQYIVVAIGGGNYPGELLAFLAATLGRAPSGGSFAAARESRVTSVC